MTAVPAVFAPDRCANGTSYDEGRGRTLNEQGRDDESDTPQVPEGGKRSECDRQRRRAFLRGAVAGLGGLAIGSEALASGFLRRPAMFQQQGKICTFTVTASESGTQSHVNGPATESWTYTVSDCSLATTGVSSFSVLTSTTSYTKTHFTETWTVTRSATEIFTPWWTSTVSTTCSEGTATLTVMIDPPNITWSLTSTYSYSATRTAPCSQVIAREPAPTGESRVDLAPPGTVTAIDQFGRVVDVPARPGRK